MRLGALAEAVLDLEPPSDPDDLAAVLRLRDQFEPKLALGIADFDRDALWELDNETSAVAWLRSHGVAPGDAIGLVKAGRRAANVSDKTADLFAQHAPRPSPRPRRHGGPRDRPSHAAVARPHRRPPRQGRTPRTRTVAPRVGDLPRPHRAQGLLRRGFRRGDPHRAAHRRDQGRRSHRHPHPCRAARRRPHRPLPVLPRPPMHRRPPAPAPTPPSTSSSTSTT